MRLCWLLVCMLHRGLRILLRKHRHQCMENAGIFVNVCREQGSSFLHFPYVYDHCRFDDIGVLVLRLEYWVLRNEKFEVFTLLCEYSYEVIFRAVSVDISYVVEGLFRKGLILVKIYNAEILCIMLDIFCKNELNI